MLYGTDSNDNPAEEITAYYYSDKLFNTPDMDYGYFNQIYSKYRRFYNQLQSDINLADSSELAESATDYMQLLDFLKANPARDDFSNEQFQQNYLEQGEETAVKLYNQALETLPASNDYAEEFKNYKSTALENSLNYLNYLDESGCISENSIDESCANSVYEYDTAARESAKARRQADNSAYNLITNGFLNLGPKCWQLKNLIIGENNS